MKCNYRGCLKLSWLMCRLGIRRALLQRGLVTWLVTEYLARREVRMYGLEYSTALLMNLCLHRAGKSQCVPIANSVLEILVKLLVQDLKQVCTCEIRQPVYTMHFSDQSLCEWSFVQSTWK